MSTWHVDLDIAQARLCLTAVKEMLDFVTPDDAAWSGWFDLQLHLERFLKQHEKESTS